MRFKQHFSLYPRKNKFGIIWYYRTYDVNGNRTPGTSTGFSSKVKAQKFCEELFASGNLLTAPNSSKPLSIFIHNFFEDNSNFMVNKMAEGTENKPALANTSIRNYRSFFKNHIYPFFKDVQVQNFNVRKVKEFREHLIKKNLNRKTINYCMTVLDIIAKELYQNEIIESNPVKLLKKLKIDNEEKVGAFTLEEAKTIIKSADWKRIEDKNITIVCCLTGMRINEVLALHKEQIHPDYIDVKYAIDPAKQNEIKNNKTKEPRIVPIIPQFYNFLMDIAQPSGFIFTMNYQCYYQHFTKFLDKINIDRFQKNYHVHSWRHFYNTYLLSENISETKVNAIIGHTDKEKTMQKIYTNFTVEHFQDVQKVNQKLWKYIFK